MRSFAVSAHSIINKITLVTAILLPNYQPSLTGEGVLFLQNLHAKQGAFYHFLKLRYGKLDDLLYIIGLNGGLVSRLISADRSAFSALTDDNISLFRVSLGKNRLQKSAAIRGSVSGIYVNVQGVKAKRTVVTRGVAEGQYLPFAVFTNEAAIVLLKSFLLHVVFLPFVTIFAAQTVLIAMIMH